MVASKMLYVKCTFKELYLFGDALEKMSFFNAKIMRDTMLNFLLSSKSHANNMLY